MSSTCRDQAGGGSGRWGQIVRGQAGGRAGSEGAGRWAGRYGSRGQKISIQKTLNPNAPSHPHLQITGNQQ